MSTIPPVRPDLGRVPETTLWTLYHRALEARRPDRVLDDPKAVELVDALDFPFADRFGVHKVLAQAQALRVRAFDVEVRRFLARHRGARIVALGEGLETQFWRMDDGHVRWTSVDLPECIDLRRRLLPPSGRQELIAGSVTDDGWPAAIADDGAPVLITAQGLLMYLEPTDVARLFGTCAARWPGTTIVFDTVPKWYSARTVAGTIGSDTYRSPPMPWGVDRVEWNRLAASTAIADLQRLRPPRGRGFLFRWLLPASRRIGAVERVLPFPAPARATLGTDRASAAT